VGKSLSTQKPKQTAQKKALIIFLSDFNWFSSQLQGLELFLKT
jgi:hypothetical protein